MCWPWRGAIRLAGSREPEHLYAQAQSWPLRSYQAFSAAFTSQYQSDSRWLPVLRDRALFPILQIGPSPRALSTLVGGSMIPPLGSLIPL